MTHVPAASDTLAIAVQDVFATDIDELWSSETRVPSHEQSSGHSALKVAAPALPFGAARTVLAVLLAFELHIHDVHSPHTPPSQVRNWIAGEVDCGVAGNLYWIPS